ncbi:hypothetical protein [Salinicola lusitanus]|uniref:Transmembrane protein n=1 Tax=Salinicola lusitanus TaxID=1949085 RepID=A0ABZ3CQJ2_9GAMM|nr:hypothetical protein [Salinicola lusitanus]
MTVQQGPAASRALTATRWSTLLGLWVVMLVSLPRYWLLHDMTRLSLLAILAAVVTVALIGLWCLMAAAERHRCRGAVGHLVACLAVGGLLISAWHWIDVAAVHWAVVVSQGAALGLLIHVVLRLWRRRR